MQLRLALLLGLVGAVSWATEPKSPPPTASKGETAEEGTIDPKADAALRKMGDYLHSLKSFGVEATTVDEKVTTEGQKVQEVQHSKMIVDRPGSLRVERVSPNGHTTFRTDGKQFSAYNKEKNVYATAAAPPDLDTAVDQFRERLHVDAPGGDLIVSDPYHALIDGVVTARYVGLEPIDGVMAHHLAVQKKDVDWQIWIKDGPDAVPLRYVITSKDMKSHPQFTLQLTNWQPEVQVASDTFAFTPPPGAKRVDFNARSKMKLKEGEGQK
jgi:hypothetical protein